MLGESVRVCRRGGGGGERATHDIYDFFLSSVQMVQHEHQKQLPSMQKHLLAIIILCNDYDNVNYFKSTCYYCQNLPCNIQLAFLQNYYHENVNR